MWAAARTRVVVALGGFRTLKQMFSTCSVRKISGLAVVASRFDRQYTN
jgi:hypothetical protein